MSQEARVLFDSAQMGAAIGARAITRDERSLLFASGPLSVDMVVYAGESGLYVIHGQVIDAEIECALSGARVCFAHAGESVETDEYGQFSLSAIGSPDGAAVTIDTGTIDVHCVVPKLCAQTEGV
jgi:hypothetical protein